MLIHELEVEFEFHGQKQTIVPSLLQDGQETILVDCGYPDFVPLLAEAAERRGVALHTVTRVIATHHDNDHIGSLAALKRFNPRLEIVAHEIEAPYIEGGKKSLRLEQAEASLERLTPEARPFALQFIESLRAIEPAKVDRTVASGEILPWCGGIEVVPTPGHMPGHISLYLPSVKTLIAADAVVIEQGRLEIANPQFTLDLEEALRSVERLLAYDIERLICYHGGAFPGDANQALRQLLDKYR